MSYNGWSNRETWLVNVWFSPETKQDVENARLTLEEEVDGMQPGVLKDMIALDNVNWRELEGEVEG